MTSMLQPRYAARVHRRAQRETFCLDRAAETLPRPALEKLQLRRLRKTVRDAYENVKLHCDRMRDLGMVPRDVRSLEDLRRLPFTVKTDLRDHYPFGMFARPRSALTRLHASSGTTGKPTVVGYTRGDIANWAALMARSLACAGAPLSVSVATRQASCGAASATRAANRGWVIAPTAPLCSAK